MELFFYHLGQVNWVAVVVAVLPSFVIGSLWYNPNVVGNYWMKQVGLKPKDAEKANMVKALSVTTAANLIAVTALATLLCALQLRGILQGAVVGALLSFAFSGASRAVHLAFEQKSPGLFLVNTSHDVLFLATAGAILGAF